MQEINRLTTRFSTESEITREMIEHSPRDPSFEFDEYIFKSQIHKLIDDIPVSILIKLFKFAKIDPTTEENKSKIQYGNDNGARWLRWLRDKGVVLFKTEINIF